MAAESESGRILYEDLVKQAEEKIELIDELFKKSDLPEQPDVKEGERVLVEVREVIYKID